jgi:polyisoprenoid-binding protein YceI
MKKVSLVALALITSLSAGSLSFDSGSIKAHTEVFGDKTIDPFTKKATSHFTMDDNPSTLKGSMEISVLDLMSDNKKRDEHMQEAIESSTFPKAIFTLEEVVVKGGDAYTLKGIMSLHGVSKPLSFESTMNDEGGKLHIKATSMIKMTDFGIKPIELMFLTVRDQLDLQVDVMLKQ